MLTKLFCSFVFLVGMSPAIASDESWTVSWSTVDNGGEIKMIDLSGASEWEVSGTIGQWDSTNTDGSASGRWELTGGFWSASITEADFLFKDSFEDPSFSH